MPAAQIVPRRTISAAGFFRVFVKHICCNSFLINSQRLRRIRREYASAQTGKSRCSKGAQTGSFQSREIGPIGNR
jgi:hypothetical protein